MNEGLAGTVSRGGLILALCGAALLLALGGPSALGATGGGNSAVAHACQKDGWESLVAGGDGVPFADQDACVSYGAQKGTILPYTECFVLDTNNSTNSSTVGLAPVVAAASAGDTIDVEGTCVGSTTIDESLVVDGTTSGFYSAPELQGASGPQPAGVLTIASGATVTVDGLEITGGDTASKGAGVDNLGTLALDDSLVTGNDGATGMVGPGLGSGIWNDGTLTLDGTDVTDNTDNQVGAGIENERGSATLIDSQVSGNTIEDSSGVVTGNGGGIENGASLTLDDTTVEDNSAAFGGGIDDLFVSGSSSSILIEDGSSIDNNTAHQGGGIANDPDGGSATVTIDDSTVASNTAETEGADALGGYGGGISNGGSGSPASLTIQDGATIEHNTASVGTGGVAGEGGGIMNSADGTVTIAGPTAQVSYNTAQQGGGIFTYSTGALVNCVGGVNVLDNIPNDIAT